MDHQATSALHPSRSTVCGAVVVVVVVVAVVVAVVALVVELKYIDIFMYTDKHTQTEIDEGMSSLCTLNMK